MKAWTSTEKGDDKIIIFTDLVIYKGNSNSEDPEKVISDFRMNLVSKSLVGTPLSNIKEINLREGKKIIELQFPRDYSVDLRIQDNIRRNEIFEYFRTNIPNSNYSLEKISPLKAAKKPLIAMIVVIAFFLWTLFYAVQIAGGNRYTTNGAITSLILGLASLGILNVVLIFGSLLLIATIAFILRLRNPPIINRITLVR